MLPHVFGLLCGPRPCYDASHSGLLDRPSEGKLRAGLSIFGCNLFDFIHRVHVFFEALPLEPGIGTAKVTSWESFVSGEFAGEKPATQSIAQPPVTHVPCTSLETVKPVLPNRTCSAIKPPWGGNGNQEPLCKGRHGGASGISRQQVFGKRKEA